jgi:hypothetical protein
MNSKQEALTRKQESQVFEEGKKLLMKFLKR